ncbi:MAG TPA: efflux RND transporter permease subunit, partial [Thermoanaerobaculia bacterium]
YLKDALKRVPGVADVLIFGERRYSLRVWLDPVLLASRQVTASDVLAALREQNVQVAAGAVGQPPAPPGQAFQISVRALGRLSEPAEFGQIVVKAKPDGTLVKLRDVGRPEIGAESYNANLTFNGQPAVGFAILQLPSANALDVDHQVLSELERLSKRFPPGFHYKVAFDTTTVVGESIREVLITLLEAILFVVLVIFLFLQEWRSTLIPAVTIPVSLVGTFAFVKLLGFSINTLTLFGITLATGLVVDDAIVVIENIQRHIHEREHERRQGGGDGVGEMVMQSASVAMREVTGAVIATSLVLVAVFVPVAFFPGTTGLLYKQFALTIAFSVALSAFNALTLTPALSALWLGRGERPRGVFFRAVNRGIDGLTAFYSRGLHGLMRLRLAVVLLFLGGLAATWWIYHRVPTGFVPAEDQGYFIVVVQAPPGASLDYTTAIASQAQAVIGKAPEVVGVFSVSGFSFSGTAPNRGLLFATLRPLSQRRGADHSVQAVVGRLLGPLLSLPGALVVPVQPPAIQGVAALGGFQFMVEDQSGGAIEALEQATHGLAGAASKSPQLRGIFASFSASDPQLLVAIDRDKAKSLGVSLGQITDTLQTFLGSVYVNDFDYNNRAYRVIAQADSRFRARPEDIKQFYVRADSGALLPLDSLVRVREVTAAQVITHYNLFRAAEIDGSPAPGVSSGEAIAAMEALAKKTLPQGMGYDWTGLALEEIRSGGQSLILFGLGLLVVYLTLSAQYESFTLPFIILLAVPVAVFGALAAQAVRGLENDVYCQIGLVMLIGLAAKNSILIVEFAEQLRERGLSTVEAAIEAARIRLRPILMTSFAFILGVLPLVFASGAGQASRHSVGTAVFGGMIVSTILNLVIIPVLYVIIRGMTRGGRVHAPASPEPAAAPAGAGDHG